MLVRLRSSPVPPVNPVGAGPRALAALVAHASVRGEVSSALAGEPARWLCT